jgi:methionine aminotransferase
MFHSKLPNLGTTIFTTMSALATEHNAINLGQGFPDYAMDAGLIELVTKAMQDGFNQYAPMAGHPLLRNAIAQKVEKLYGNPINPGTEITITPGGTYAIYSAITSIIHPGDEAIVFEPAYDSYIPNIEVNGGIPVIVKLKHPTYSIDWEEVKSKINSKTRLILINTPHNPTGSVLGKSDLLELQKIVVENNLYLLSDEVYEHLIFDGKQHESALKYPELFKRSFVCFSLGKVYNCTGWKLGYCIAPALLTAEFRKVHQFNCFSCHTPSQIAMAAYLGKQETYLSIGPFLQQKKIYFEKLMAATPFQPLPSFGSYFQLYSYESFSQETEKELAVRLVKEVGVASIPVSAFYTDGTDNKVLRFCFAKQEKTLEDAVEKLKKLF